MSKINEEKMATGEITEFVKDIESRLCNLEAAIDTLKEKLEPVCSEYPEVTERVSQQSSSTPLGFSLADINDRLRTAVEKIRTLLETIEV